MPAPVRARAPGLPTVWATMPFGEDADAGVAARLAEAVAGRAALAEARTVGEAAFVVAEVGPVAADAEAAGAGAATSTTLPSADSDRPAGRSTADRSMP